MCKANYSTSQVLTRYGCVTLFKIEGFKELLEAMNEHHLEEGLIITFEQEELEEKLEIENKKIRIIPAWKWLLEEKKLRK